MCSPTTTNGDHHQVEVDFRLWHLLVTVMSSGARNSISLITSVTLPHPPPPQPTQWDLTTSLPFHFNTPFLFGLYWAVAISIVPDWGIKSTLCLSQLFPPVRDYEFGYWCWIRENTYQDAQKTGWWASLFIFNSFLFVLVIAKLTR